MVTASEQITGDVQGLDGDLAVISTASGERRVALREIVNLLLHAQSPGPE